MGMTGRELSRPFVEYSSDWVRANVRPPQPIGERMVLSARDLLKMWRDLVVESDGVPRYTVLPGAALNTLVGWTDDELTRPLTGGVTEEMVEAGFRVLWATELRCLGDTPERYKQTAEAIYLAMSNVSRGVK
jgi:hypothetical protein